MKLHLSIIIPTKDRAPALAQLLASLKRLNGLTELRPEIIVADNGSDDNTPAMVQDATNDLPTEVKMITTTRAGKSAALNDALKIATGDYLAFLDDDVVVDGGWLQSLEKYIRESGYQAGQGTIGLQGLGADDPKVRCLIDKFRTIPQISFPAQMNEVRLLNGANFFIARKILDQVGGFNERLGPGASGTSEDVELAQRLAKTGVRLGYARDTVVYHQIDHNRLTEAYFREHHRRQGQSRFLMKNRGYLDIIFDVGRAYLQYFYYSLAGNERSIYRSKGRIFHYLAMFEAKRRGPATGRN
jgi:GT2 family glycosyltransferase